jgi:DNA-binding NarL/FixJ family response regulator
MQADALPERWWDMNAATVGPALSSWAPTVAAVVGGDPGGRRHVAELLATAGFTPHHHEDPQARIDGGPGTLAVLVGSGKAADRIRDIRTVAEASPKALIVATMPSDAANALLRRALIAGAAGLVLDDDLDRALAATARAALAGQLAVPSALVRQIAPRPLSYREKQILGLVVLGFTNREIADKLFLAESTVKTHLSSSFAKLDAHSRSEAAARILDPDSGYGVGILAIADDGTAPGS